MHYASRRYTYKKFWILVSTLLVALCLGFASRYYYSNNGIVDYDSSAEQQVFLQQLFKDNMYLLVSEESDFSLDHMLRYKVSRKNDPSMPLHTMKLYKDHGKLVGFTTYYYPYMHQIGHGLVLFLVVDAAARGKGYGRKLLEYALNDLRKQGCTSVELAVRIENAEAQKLYKKLGFYEYWRDDKFIRMKRLLL